MNITIETINIENLHMSRPVDIPPMERAFLSALIASAMSQDATPAEPPAFPEVPAIDGRPRIGEYWPSQGGIYAGDFRGDDGVIYGLIVADCGEDAGRARWAPDGERSDLSTWDGLANTQALRDDCPAAKLASDYQADGYADFYLPARRELQLAVANVPHIFGAEGWYWSSTPYTDSYAWAVDFEFGDTRSVSRDGEFRVRPFRRVVIHD